MNESGLSIYAQLVTHGLAAAFLTRPGDGAILYANPAACELFGYTLDEFLTLGRSSVIDLSDSKATEALAKRLETGRFQGVLPMRRKDGSWFSAAVASAVYKDNGEQRNSMFVWDITEQEQREEALRVINAELTRTLAEERQLLGKLPICSYCKRIRDEQQNWQEVERYISAHAPVQFSHSICPTCYDHQIRPQMERHKKGTT